MLVGGDVIPHRPSLASPRAVGSALAPLAPLFGAADAVIVNHEAATGELDRRAPKLAYAAPTEWMGALAGAGVTAVTVANNHACDLGDEGLDATLEEASRSSVVAIGGDADDPWAPRVVATTGDRRVCAVAWTTLSNRRGACGRGRRMAVAPLTPEGKSRVDLAMRRARAACDGVVAIVHGGDEYAGQTTLVLDQAARAAEAGADAVVAHHPHVPSPISVRETRDGRRVPIFASLGNLVTNQGESWTASMPPVRADDRRLVCVNGWTRLGVLADLRFSFEDDRARLSWGAHLVWVDNEHATNREAVEPRIEARLLEPTADAEIVATLVTDRGGPTALFSEPCWHAREGAAPERDPRCASEGARAKAEEARPTKASPSRARAPERRAQRTRGEGARPR